MHRGFEYVNARKTYKLSGHPAPVLDYSHNKNVFSCVQIGLSLLLLVLLLGITEGSLALFSLLFHQVFILMDEILLHFLFSRFSSRKSFSFCL